MGVFDKVLTEYGFKWGPVEVIRVMEDAKHGVFLTLRTTRQELEVRVTPSGLIRSGTEKVGKEVGEEA